MKNDAVLTTLLDLRERFGRVEERLDHVITRDEFLTRMDAAMVILQRLDQERVFTNETIRRLQKQVEEQQKDISRLKRALNIS